MFGPRDNKVDFYLNLIARDNKWVKFYLNLLAIDNKVDFYLNLLALSLRFGLFCTIDEVSILSKISVDKNENEI